MNSRLVTRTISSPCRPHSVPRCSALPTLSPDNAISSLKDQRQLPLLLACRYSLNTDSSASNIPIHNVNFHALVSSLGTRNRVRHGAVDNLVPENVSPPHPVTENPLPRFRSRISRGKATKEAASQCLKNFKRYLQNKPVDERGAVIEETAAGLTVIDWLWDNYNDIRELEDGTLINLMVHFLIAEGRESMVWDWISKTQPDMLDTSYKMQLVWRRLTATALIRAKSKDPSRSLDEAFDAFAKLLDMDNRGPHRVRIPLEGPTQWLLGIVNARPSDYPTPAAQYYPNTSAEKWRRFYAALPRATTGWRQARAFMSLYALGSKNRDPLPALKLLEEIHSNELSTYHWIHNPAKLLGLGRRFGDCAVLLDTLGHHEKSAWATWATDEYFLKKAFSISEKKQTESQAELKPLEIDANYTSGDDFSELAL